jgi:hypothetical protein
MLAVRNDGFATTLTSANGDYSPIAVDNKGRIFTVSEVSGSFLEDSAHTSGDNGMQMLAVRKDSAGTNVSANGDYASILQWGNGETKVVDIANSSILQQEFTLTTANTAYKLPATALAWRKSILVQNTSDKDIFIGTSTVTATGATKGIKVPKDGGFMELDAGPDCEVWAVCATSSKNVTLLEMA